MSFPGGARVYGWVLPHTASRRIQFQHNEDLNPTCRSPIAFPCMCTWRKNIPSGPRDGRMSISLVSIFHHQSSIICFQDPNLRITPPFLQKLSSVHPDSEYAWLGYGRHEEVIVVERCHFRRLSSLYLVVTIIAWDQAHLISNLILDCMRSNVGLALGYH